MKLFAECNGKLCPIDLTEGISIFSAPNFDDIKKETPFGLNNAVRRRLLTTGDEVGCNCDELTIIPHAHGTHIESIAHVSNSSCDPLKMPDFVHSMIINDLNDVESDENVEFLIVRRGGDSKVKGFNGFDSSIIESLFTKFPSLIILGTNEPSFDPENDDGRLDFHRNIFNRKDRTIFLVEMLDLDNSNLKINIVYLCNLNIYKISGTDAMPCCPILYPLNA